MVVGKHSHTSFKLLSDAARGARQIKFLLVVNNLHNVSVTNKITHFTMAPRPSS